MHLYCVSFYYNTDLRTERYVTAYDELKALALALQAEGLNEWIIGGGFRIEIKRA